MKQDVFVLYCMFRGKDIKGVKRVHQSPYRKVIMPLAILTML